MVANPAACRKSTRLAESFSPFVIQGSAPRRFTPSSAPGIDQGVEALHGAWQAAPAGFQAFQEPVEDRVEPVRRIPERRVAGIADQMFPAFPKVGERDRIDEVGVDERFVGAVENRDRRRLAGDDPVPRRLESAMAPACRKRLSTSR